MGPASGPARVLLLALMVGVTVYHLGRLARRRHRSSADVDVAHALMGTVMALMLARGVDAGDARLLAASFVIVTGWFAVRGVRAYVLAGARDAGPIVLRTVPGAAMVYMLAVASRPDAGMAMPSAPSPLTWLVVAGLALATVPGVTSRPGTRPRPTLDAGCRVAMSATACVMLLGT